MAQIAITNPIAGVAGVLNYAGTPGAGTNSIHTLTIGGTPTAGSFTITYDGQTTGAITWSATNSTLVANIDAALEALTNIGTGGVVTATGTMTSGIGTITITAGVNLAKQVISTMTCTSSLTGTSPTLGIAQTTPGVTAFARGRTIGTQVNDVTNGVGYINTGTALAPTYTKIGTQS